MKYSLFILFSALLSCGPTQRRPAQEKGYVVAMQYVASVNASGTTTTINPSNGHIGIGYTSISEDEKYMVVFKCEHGVVFSINNKELFAKLNEKDSVAIDFFELIDRKGNVYDFDFIDANKTGK